MCKYQTKFIIIKLDLLWDKTDLLTESQAKLAIDMMRLISEIKDAINYPQGVEKQ